MKRVMVIAPHEPALARGIQVGIARYARSHGPWRFVAPRQMGGGWQYVPADLDELNFEGAILPVIRTADVERLTTAGIPFVSVTAFPSVPRVTNDNAAIGRLGARHLLGLGFRRLAFAGLPKTIYSRDRHDAFLAEARQADVPCAIYTEHFIERDDWRWPQLQEKMSQFLKTLTWPCGMMTDTNARARQIIEAATSMGIIIPEQLAVLSVDNDESLCEMSQPSLSCVALDGERVGFEAAAMLDRFMQGEPAVDQCRLIPPLSIEVRQSTDTLAIDDPAVAAALRFIRSRPNRPMTIAQVLDHVPLSQRALERRFQQRVGHTLFTEIRRVQLAHVQHLLTQTDWSIQQIARASAFANAKRLGEVFREAIGESPTAYRRRFQYA
ncbi:MAG: substrate-binding domain-containing protein [Phycisphaeraceae bacterium]